MGGQKGGNGEPKTAERRLIAAKKQAEAMQMRSLGMSLDEIAKRLGYASPSGAVQAIQAGLRRMLKGPADELRKIEDERLDVAQRKVAEIMLREQVVDEDGNRSPTDTEVLRAVDRWIEISRRRSKLWGLDMPVKVEATLKNGNAERAGEAMDRLDGLLSVLRDRASSEAAMGGEVIDVDVKRIEGGNGNGRERGNGEEKEEGD